MIKKSKKQETTIGTISEKEYKEVVASLFMMAKVYKDKYDALVEVGFTKYEALEIIKSRGMNA